MEYDGSNDGGKLVKAEQNKHHAEEELGAVDGIRGVPEVTILKVDYIGPQHGGDDDGIQISTCRCMENIDYDDDDDATLWLSKYCCTYLPTDHHRSSSKHNRSQLIPTY